MPDIDYDHHASERAAFSQKVIDSNSVKRLVMAGPGTGKSFLFQQVAKNLRSQEKDTILVLTFINELVRDLSIDMHGLAEVSTLHSFAAKKLSSRQNIYLDLLTVISDDHKMELDIETGIKYSEILNNLDTYGHEGDLDYLAKRRKYYKAYDPTTIVFELVSLYIRDETKIPSYDLIMIDEFQDFNELETKLIELLSTKSPVLIAGDDDQSLYSFKHSRPETIRSMHASDDYETFELPYCSRSTRVVIDAFHDFLASAQNNGHLMGRVGKQYLYFPDQKKDKFSDKYPKLDVRTKVYDTKNAYTVDEAIKDIFQFDPKFNVLIICPLNKQISKIADALRKKGYSNVSGDENTGLAKHVLVDGLRILFTEKESNLGWRLCTEVLAGADVLKNSIKKSADFRKSFKDCLPREMITKIKKLRAITVKLQAGQLIGDEDRELFFENLGVEPNELGEAAAKELIFGSSASGNLHCTTNIKITTILGSKGLSYDYVFMINFDDQYLLPRDGEIDDESINKFFVALTRSRKKIFIYTTKSVEPTFVSWISQERKTVS